MRVYTTTLHTPIGPFTLVGGEDGICASGFTDRVEDLRIRDCDPAAIERVQDLGEYSRAVAAYFDGDVSAIDGIPVTQQGSAFHRAAWKELRQIPAGIPISYSELAARLEHPAASRAAGTACGRNAVALIVPCHRVVRMDGGLGGFAWHVDRKRWLLDYEARIAQHSPD
jgi:methylated-DNA-[protein]-cysteine S-methyltransferase